VSISLRKRKTVSKRQRRREAARRAAERRRRKRIAGRLDKHDLSGCELPMMTGSNIHYEISGRQSGTAAGGIGLVQRMVCELELAEMIDRRLHLLKVHLPYHESDHVLNLAYNALCGGHCLEDLELRRADQAYMDGLGARRIPDPTTAGDFCRRFAEQDVRTLLDIFDQARCQVWARQRPEFFVQARIDLDGTLVATGAECKQGIDIAYNGTWGYHPLVVSLANTGEVLSIVNRSGNRPSHEGAAAEANRAIRLCLESGFQSVLLRGDTDFTQTKYLDAWDADGRVRFIFGVDCQHKLHILADDLRADAWQPLLRPAKYEVKTQPRQRPENVKQPIVQRREFRNIRLESEFVAEFDYRPVACQKTYRMIVLRKNLAIEKGQERLFNDYRYFFYITNDRELTPAEVVFQANDRCDQENLHAQLKGGVHSLTAPVDNLVSNWAYMVMTSLAWNLKAWLALWLPDEPPTSKLHDQRQAEKRTLLRMEFRTFVNAMMLIPCQVLRTGRRIVFRLLAWNPWQAVFLRLIEQFRPQRR
jgi:hypothetical protein